MQVSIHEAKTEFLELISLLESKQEESITVTKDGKPAFLITPINEAPVSRRIGTAKGRFTLYGDFDADNKELEMKFTEV